MLLMYKIIVIQEVKIFNFLNVDIKLNFYVFLIVLNILNIYLNKNHILKY